MSKAEEKAIVVTVGDEALKDIQSLAEKLTAKGMSVKQVMPITGVIAGSVQAKKMAALKKVKGVLDVGFDAIAHLPGPDEPQ